MAEAVLGQVGPVGVCCRELPTVLRQDPTQAQEVDSTIARVASKRPTAIEQMLLRHSRDLTLFLGDLALNHTDGAETPARAARPLIPRRAYKPMLTRIVRGGPLQSVVLRLPLPAEVFWVGLQLHILEMAIDPLQLVRGPIQHVIHTDLVVPSASVPSLHPLEPPQGSLLPVPAICKTVALLVELRGHLLEDRLAVTVATHARHRHGQIPQGTWRGTLVVWLSPFGEWAGGVFEWRALL